MIVWSNLSLQSHGLRVYLRDPNSFAPVLGTNQYLLLGNDAAKNRREIGKFSQKDAEVSVIDIELREESADSAVTVIYFAYRDMKNMDSGWRK